MYDVLAALVPVTLGAIYYFGIGALLVVLACIAGAVFTEWLFNRREFQMRDGTLILTGLLLGLTLPPTFPLWMAFVGGVAAIGLGRLIWGGLGQNIFNPALVGRAFLQAAFPTAIGNWYRAPGDLSSIFAMPKTLMAVPLMGADTTEVDAVSTATPLKLMWQKGEGTDFTDLMAGDVAGSIGETVGILILIGGIYLLVRRTFDWRIPVSILLTVAVASALFHWLYPAKCPTPEFMIASGGLLLGAIFMATDPVTSPMSPLGVWIFGIGIGILVVLIRVWAALPEGVMYAILLMNAATPLIDRAVRPTALGRRFGGEVAK